LKLDRIFKAVVNNLPAKVVSIIVAFILFMIYENNATEETKISVPVNFIYNENLIPVEDLTKYRNIDVTVKSDHLLSQDEKADFFFEVDLSDVKEPRRITNKKIEIKNKSEKEYETTQEILTVSLTLDRKVSKVLPIKVDSENSLDNYEPLFNYFPNTVTVTGPESVLKDLDQVLTEKIPISDSEPDKSVTVDANLILPEGVQNPNVTIDLTSVSVAISLKDIIHKKTFDDVPFSIFDSPDFLEPSYDTGKREVTVSGPKVQVSKIKAGDFSLTVDAENVNAPGTYEFDVVLGQLNKDEVKDVIILKYEPRKVKITFVKREETEE
jgi:hypothetical protein